MASAIRSGLRSSVVAALGLIGLCFGTATAEDWPSVLGPRGDGSSEETLSLPWPAEGPEILWWKAVGEGYSAPVVAAGRLFVFDRTRDETRLSAWDASSGREIWQARYKTGYEDNYGYSGGPRAAPLVDGERVFTYGVEGRLRAHAVSDGRLLWEVDTAARFGVVQNFFGVGASPVVEGELLIAQVGGSPTGSPPVSSGHVEGNGSGIVAFDKAGRLLLVKATPERFVKVAELDLGAGSTSDNSRAKTAIAASTERPRLLFPAWNAPVLSNGRLYLRGRDQIICLKVGTPRKVHDR